MDRWMEAQEGELKWWQSFIQGTFPSLDREEVRECITDVGTRRISHFQIENIQGKVLDVGSSPLSAHEGREGCQVVAIEPLLDSLALIFPQIVLLGKVGNVDYRCCKIQDVPETDFDVVWCTNVFDHTEDWQDIILNIVRVLKPGGLLLLGTDVRHSPESLNKMHISLFDEPELLAELEPHFNILWHTPFASDDRYYFCVRALRRCE